MTYNLKKKRKFTNNHQIPYKNYNLKTKKCKRKLKMLQIT